MSIAENIRTIRKESGMSQTEVGARLGITGSMINQIEPVNQDSFVGIEQRAGRYLWLHSGGFFE